MADNYFLQAAADDLRRRADEYLDSLPTEPVPGRPIDVMRGFWRNVAFPEMSERSFARFWAARKLAERYGAIDAEADCDLWTEWLARVSDRRGNLNCAQLERLARCHAVRAFLEREGIDADHHLRGRDELTSGQAVIVLYFALDGR